MSAEMTCPHCGVTELRSHLGVRDCLSGIESHRVSLGLTAKIAASWERAAIVEMGEQSVRRFHRGVGPGPYQTLVQYIDAIKARGEDGGA